MYEGRLRMRGDLGVRVNGRRPLGWQLRNMLRWAFWWGLLSNFFAKQLSALTGIPTLTAELRIRIMRRDGTTEDYGVVSRRVVTDAGAAAIIDAFTNTFELETFNYHGAGTGTGSESASDTALGTESTTVLDPNSTRATGTQSQPAANQYRSVGTLFFDGDAAITEHGLFSQSATGGGTLLDRSVFAVLNLGEDDSIEFTYTLTANSGG